MFRELMLMATPRKTASRPGVPRPAKQIALDSRRASLLEQRRRPTPTI